MKLRCGWVLRRSRSFKVIEVGTNRKSICDFLLVINSNLAPILHRFRDIALERSKIATFLIILIIFIHQNGRNTYEEKKPNMAILDVSKGISRKRCEIRGKILLMTNRKSHMSFRLVPKSVTLNGVIA